MNFDELFANVCDALQREQRISYRALRRRFELSDDDLEDLKVEIIKAKRLAIDEDGEILVWTGDTESAVESTLSPAASEHVFEPTQAVQNTVQTVEPQPPEAERRQLTVMFIDLVDSTRLSSELDPEIYRELVREYQRSCTEVVVKYSGYTAQYLGDGLLVYFGYPQAHEDDAQRSVRSGLGIIEAIGSLNTRLEQSKGITLAVRLGIHTGLAVVGEMGGSGRQEQLALGETPNVAARIQGLAEPNTVVISEATYRIVQGFFDVEPLGEHELRGVVQPIAVYRILGHTGIQSRLDVAGIRGLTPLVGRESECALLFERWEQAKDGNGQVVLVSGEAGIGKSRLIQVLKDHVANEPHTRIECRSSPYFANSALYPITDFLQRMLRFQADDTLEQKLEKLTQNLSQFRLPLDESVPLHGALLSLSVPEDQYPPLNLSPQRQRQKTLEAIVAMILELAERQPVLFILEDLHWTDPTTLELLQLLIDQTPTASLYVLLTCRPEFQPSWSHRSYLTEMTLNRLSRSQIVSIATQVAGGKTLPDEVVEQLVDRTDGVPLYVEEMTKAVLESGVLKEMDERYELTSSIASLSIPATLQDSLMARLDRLVTAKGIAQYASVIGRQFSYELLQAVSGLDEATLQRELGRLAEAELVYQRGLPPQATYTFKHALIQDTAYESLLRSTRQGYHRRIAEILEKRFPETAENQPELLAHHYTEAGLHEQAIANWQRAGQRANTRSAYQEAIHNLTRGLGLLAGMPDTSERSQREFDLQLALIPPLMGVKGFAAPEVEQVHARLHVLSQQVEEGLPLVQVLRSLWTFYNVSGQRQKARDITEQILELSRRLDEPVCLIDAHYAVGGNLLFSGEFVSALPHLEQVISLCRQLNDSRVHYARDPIATELPFVVLIHWYLGYPEQALRREQELITLVRELASPFELAFALTWTTLFHHCLREENVVLRRTEELIALCKERGFTQLLTIGQIFQGVTLTAQGDEQEGITQMCQALDAHEATGARLHRVCFFTLLAGAYGKAGQAEKGLAMLAKTVALAEQTEERYYEAELYRLKGQLLLQQSSDNATESESCFQKAISIAQNQQAKSWELRASTSLAKLWQRQGKRQEAYDLLAPVYGWFTEGYDTADLIDAKALLNELS